jgi:predicted nucleic acid-binding protein
LNRPFDDQSQTRVRLEAEAVLSILKMADQGQLEILGSDILDDELSQDPDVDRREKVELLLGFAATHVGLTTAIERRAVQFHGWSIAVHDALHLASAEAGRADYFLTTDDHLVRRARRHAGELKVTVENPARWLMQETTDEN